MKKYEVRVYKQYSYTVTIEANSEEEAKLLVWKGHGSVNDDREDELGIEELIVETEVE